MSWFGLAVAMCLVATKCPALTIEQLSPPHEETNVATPPELSVFLHNTTSSNLTVTFYGRLAPSPVRPNFTIVALPDTQFYSGSVNGGTPEIFVMQTEWIITNRVSRNIVFVSQLGDCVQHGNTESEWWAATNALYRLEDPSRTFLEHGIPYGICPGGHDTFYPYPDFRLYNKYFGVAHFSGKPYYAGHYGTNNDNHFELISASGLDLLLLHLEWNAGVKVEVMNWANTVLQQHSDRRAIVITHSLLRPGVSDGPQHTHFNAQGQPIYDGLKANTNIFLMLCGHWPQARRRWDTYNGNTIHTLLSDYTNEANGGNGYLRIMEFSPSNSTLRVQTYSPYLNQYKFDYPYNDFTISGIDLSPLASGFVPLQVVGNVAPGVVRSFPWQGLQPGTNYDWYVTVSDGETSAQTPFASFQTSQDFPRTESLPPGTPYIFRTLRQSDGSITILWRSIGGARYRVEFSDGSSQSGIYGSFQEVIRSEAGETDPSPPGVSSVQVFTDDFSLTAGPAPEGMRFYRVKRME